MPLKMENVDILIGKLYKLRFKEKDRIQKNLLWATFCNDFLQRFIKENDVVLDLGAGYCEFINNIRCGKKIAVDFEPHIKQFAAKDVSVIINNAVNLRDVATDSIDVVFVSELFEHLNNKNELIQSLAEIHRILKRNGRLIIICPNIIFLGGHYWDYLDHVLPLNHRSLAEALELMGYKIKKMIIRFLPFSTKGNIPKLTFFLKIYLKLPLLWRIFGKQMFILAVKLT